jgi:uncharacterized protein DUF4154
MLRRRFLAGVFVFAIPVGASPSAQAPTIEYDVKAAFLLNFTRFVEWPPAARSGHAFGLCTLEPDPFGNRLESAAAGEVWDGLPIAVRRISTLRTGECHLLYVPAASMPAFRTMQREVSAQSILTVGDSRDFLERGGMIQFLVESNRVRFSINTRNTQAVGLKVGSRLLRLAKDVVSKEDPLR